MNAVIKPGECQACRRYVTRRGAVIQREIDRTSRTTEEFNQRWERFMAAFHERHVRLNAAIIRRVANREVSVPKKVVSS